jgi:hypothetical protein
MKLVPPLATIRLLLGQDSIDKTGMYFYLSNIEQARIDAKESKVPLGEIIDNWNNIKREVLFNSPPNFYLADGGERAQERLKTLIRNRLPSQIKAYNVRFSDHKVYLERRNLQIVFRLEISQDQNQENTKLVPSDFRTSIDDYLIDMYSVQNETRI